MDNFFQGVYLSPRKLEEKIEARIVQLSYNNLKNHIRSKIGQYKTYQAIPLRCKQRKGTHPTIKSLMVHNKSGSGVYRRILSRGDKQTDINSPTSWKKKLNDNTITSLLVKRMKTNLLSKALPSDANDVLTRLKLGRTLFGQSGVHAGVLDDPWCIICLKEDNMEVEDSFLHSVLHSVVYMYLRSLRH